MMYHGEESFCTTAAVYLLEYFAVTAFGWLGDLSTTAFVPDFKMFGKPIGLHCSVFGILVTSLSMDGDEDEEIDPCTSGLWNRDLPCFSDPCITSLTFPLNPVG
eukprot:CAMPEP_0114493328 /NCGR_PEP_ID=MMETSP0109-20121206/4050_1 /TAXON_ID=29199 /ORGANISM="Chlorarachnion reptans, Strain CCCM449" /LENGTH=103 /DNA_ID=CAMNT_0001670271 /DNA_START=434 /DNA_END=746 /DNA_ORIENTATION=+